MDARIKNNEKILFIGDSITDCGRRAAERPLGNGYVRIFRDYLIIRASAKKVVMVNKGIDGDTSVALLNRLEDDLLRHKPDRISIQVGINDLYRHLARAADGVSPESYEEVYRKMLKRIRSELPRCMLLLIQPFYISRESSKDSFRQNILGLLPQYLKVVEKMSEEFNTRMVRTHAMFQNLLKYYEPDVFCLEPVHPNLTGHAAIASAVYDLFCRS
ncbi:MAG: SGNH/GDSL hydrolase family protein [Kiritimatiellae bacterium]|nr:SGNH/GDSL hydrolase family protein [Kiritimatiellia bacterium]